jgi:hypothetical protein
VRSPRRLIAAFAVIGLLPAAASAGAMNGGTLVSLARYTDTATSTAALSTDTLDPPTSLAATGGPLITLTWTATPDTYAAGYDVLRGTASGGPYSVIKSVTPRTTVTTTDSPAVGTYYYVLRSTFQSWTSVNGNQASGSVTALTNTGLHACTGTSNAADTGGDGNGYQTNPNRACATADANATDTNSGTNTTLSCTDPGKDRHRWWDFNLGVPTTAQSIAGITVRADEGMSNNGGTSWLCVQLSWDGGTSWTAADSVVLTATGLTTYTLGGATDTWGRTWTGSELSNASFRVRVIDASTVAGKDFNLDYLAVQVNYYP